MMDAQDAVSFLKWGKRVNARSVRFWPGVVSLFVALVAGGCVRTIQPVLKDSQLVVDNSVVGKWVDKENDKLEVQPAGADKTYEFRAPDKDGHESDLIGRLGKVGDLMIVEYRANPAVLDAMDDNNKALLLPLYSFYVVRQKSPQLILSTMDSGWLKKYVADHPDELQVLHPGGQGDDLIISSKTEDFQAFLLRHVNDKGAMSDKVVYGRPGDPATRPSGPGK